MKPKLFITAQIPQNAIELLSEHFDINYHNSNLTLTKKELMEKVKTADILICLLKDNIDKDVIDAGKNLKGICNYAVGYNNIDVNYATQKGIIVTNTPGVLTETTADLAWALLMATARRIVEADNFVRNGKFTGWQATLLLGNDIYGKTLGIIGAGRIGTATAKRALGFDMKILYHSNHKNDFLETELNAKKVNLETLLKNSDFVSLHLPLTPKTHHLITKNEFAMMKKTAIIINTARGAIIKEKDLVNALKNKTIAGAGLDVFEFEPKITEELLEMQNVVLAPHIGSASKETREKMAEITAQAAIDISNGKIPDNSVNVR